MLLNTRRCSSTVCIMLATPLEQAIQEILQLCSKNIFCVCVCALMFLYKTVVDFITH